MQAVILPASHRQHLHMALDCGDSRHEALAVETVAVQLLGWLIGRGDNHHALVEQHLEQPAKNDRIANVVDEQFVEAQHPDLAGELPGQRLQWVGSAVQLKQALVHPRHEMVEMLASAGHGQAAMELVHQPGLATADRPP